MTEEEIEASIGVGFNFKSAGDYIVMVKEYRHSSAEESLIREGDYLVRWGKSNTLTVYRKDVFERVYDTGVRVDDID